MQAEVQAEMQAAHAGAAGADLGTTAHPGSAAGVQAASILTLTLQYRCSRLLHLAFFVSEHHLYQNRMLL